MPVLVTGATGTIGRRVARQLTARGVQVRAASRRGDTVGAGTASVRFDYLDRPSWAGALDGVRVLFVVRPPDMTDVTRDLLPFLDAARSAGVRHVTFLSVQGADRLTVVPHARVERWLRGSGLGWTIVRPSFFMQNLITAHAQDLRAGTLVLPAGHGRTAFVDAEDVAAVAAAALADPVAHDRRVWTPTGSQALSYDEVARDLSEVLDRPVRYRAAGLVSYARHARRGGTPWPLVAVTAAIYTTARLGLAAGLTTHVATVTGHPPATLRDVVTRDLAAWRAAIDGAVTTDSTDSTDSTAISDTASRS